MLSYPSFTTVNIFSGSTLNRLSWLRTDDLFLNGALRNGRFLVFERDQPLVHTVGEDASKLAKLPWTELRDFFPHDSAAFGGKANGITHPNLSKATTGMVAPDFPVVFLGLQEDEAADTSISTKEGQVLKGQPYFAVSVSFSPQGKGGTLKSLLLQKHLEFTNLRTLAISSADVGQGWSLFDAALAGQANSLLDWNLRNRYCPACASPQISVWGGWKRSCSSCLGAHVPAQLETAAGGAASIDDCPSLHSVHNFSYPRTDPVTIMAVISSDGERILLGRKANVPAGLFGCLAGFVEPGEALEDAVRREVHEEVGLTVGPVYYHSSQPWPFPASLMFGAIAQLLPGQNEINLNLDRELETARFFTRQEILHALEAGHIDKPILAEKEDGEEDHTVDTFRIPPSAAVAHVLIAAWAKKEAVLPPPASE